MTIEGWQILVICLFAFIQILDVITVNVGLGYPLNAGMITGLIMGDVTTGLAVGATLQLMVLGVGTYGGASIPDFTTGAIIGTIFAVISGKGIEFAIGLAVPVGLLLIQLDILARFLNTFFLHRIIKAIDRLDIGAIERNVLAGALPWGLSRMLPVLLMLLFGEHFVQLVLYYAPGWLMGGLKVAGGVLPVVGIGILLRYLPTRQFFPWLLIGFFAAAWLKTPMLGVAVLGIAGAIIHYRNVSSTEKRQPQDTPRPAVLTTSGEITDDEI
ncbi:PTS mannose/fructose/sorbose/N-acetylgalactosamine transporter subunit IIC [[Enterobacter] lignolyticus]|uniref:Phosphotransferase system PTS sorbose-specific IIC subunit n=1 Tax=Enterobacter lignolyticus (strain SCF1) TaxID=701347 RepID=E3G1I4_ENTLS|nr:PTS sugar transporter subunit IIC [[Enterobacter] lignolyticus]ADO50269.1 phosphotransferase system PTS sorbose-specific IIC subunit [[Enterobacter] lignolyticus SCF1]